MKTLSTIIVLIIMTINLIAQKDIEISETTQDIAGGRNNSIVVTIYEASEDLIMKEWKKLMKDYDAKITDKKEMFADNALIKAISDNTIDVYAKTEKKQDGVTNFIVAMDLGGAFLSSSQHPNQFKEAKKMIYLFAVNITKEAINEQLSEQEKAYSKLTGELKQLEKEQEQLKKDIDDYKKRIEKAEKDIETNIANQKEKKKEIETQQKVVDNLKAKAKAVK